MSFFGGKKKVTLSQQGRAELIRITSGIQDLSKAGVKYLKSEDGKSYTRTLDAIDTGMQLIERILDGKADKKFYGE